MRSDQRLFEQNLIQMSELQPKAPSWTKGEHMEMIVPQTELRKYRDTFVRIKHGKRIRFAENRDKQSKKHYYGLGIMFHIVLKRFGI